MLAPSLLAIVAVMTATTTATTDQAARGAEIDRALREDARASRLWYTGWTTFYTVATAFSMKVAIDAESRDRRVGAAVDAVRSGLGLVTTVLFVPPSMTSRRLASDDVSGRETWLQEAADAERLGRSWLTHAANAAVNAAGGGYLWLHERRFVAGLVAFVSGTVIGEIKIWTQPTTALEAHRAANARSDVSLALSPMVSTTTAALVLDGRF